MPGFLRPLSKIRGPLIATWSKPGTPQARIGAPAVVLCIAFAGCNGRSDEERPQGPLAASRPTAGKPRGFHFETIARGSLPDLINGS